MKYFKTVLTLTIIMFLSSLSSMNAQNLYALYDLTMSDKEGTWEPMSGGTYITNGDDSYGYFPIPFTFRLDGQNFTWGYANCNGYITLGYAGTSITLTPGFYSPGYNAIAWANGDLYTYNGIYYQTTGSAPNRVFTIQWNYVRIPYYTGDHYVDAQVKLYETSNKIEMIYGPSTGTPMSFTLGVFISGRRIISYGPVYNINPAAVHPGSYPSPRYIRGNNYYQAGYTGRHLNASGWNTYFPRGFRFIYGKSDPELMGTYPAGGEIYKKGAVYGGTGDEQKHPAVFVKRASGMPAVFATYRIFGPLGDNNPIDIYRAKDGGNGSYSVNMGNITGDSTRYDFTVGTGICFGTNGVLDFLTNSSGLTPGEYGVDASMIIDQVGTLTWDPVTFNIALPWDIAVKKIFRPRSKYEKKYPLDQGIPITINIGNFGLNSITNFEVFAEIYDKNNNRIFQNSTEWTNTTDSLKSAQAVDINLGIFYPTAVGDYRMTAWVTLGDATDQLLTNNIVPRAGDGNYYFSISKEVDLKAVSIVAPKSTDEVMVGRPMVPRARFTNQGVNDVDNDYIAFEITYQNGEVVYRDTVFNYVISAGARFDTTDVSATKNFIPPYLGNYSICAVIYSVWDDNPLSVRTTCTNFSVNAGLLGNYTVGSGTGSKHFATIEEAVDALYKYGVGGNVNFELKDRGPYVIGSLTDDKNPALDLSGHITGLGPNARVTFKPSNDRAVERAALNSGVTIHVQTGSGYGILMGQNEFPVNAHAIVLTVPPSQRNKFATPNGYIDWDGGQNKSIRFILKTPTDVDKHFHSVFYLRQGAKNHQIKNCIFENDYKDLDGIKRTPHVYLPKVKVTGNTVAFMKDKEYSSTGYSAAIVMRTIPPTDKEGSGNINNLDTIAIHNNVISGNEINGFGYGIVNLGAGPLLRSLHNKWFKYYNYNNVISNNIIRDVARAGIYLGYTDGEMVKGNRIYNVTGNYLSHDDEGMESKGGQVQAGGSKVSYDAGGIIAGGETEPSWYGFNNLNLSIVGNEISSVKSDYVAYGIKVEQVRNVYGSITIPDVKEKTLVMNNIIWGMDAKSNNPSVSRVGIRLFTQRINLSDFLVAQDPDYFTWDDKVLSNTIIIPDDGGSTSGAIAGIAVQHSKATKILNNAVAVLDELIDAGSPASALIFYQGILPSETHGLESNRNAFWRTNYEDEKGAAAYGFVELNKDGEFIEPISANLYDANGYETLRQWRNWTKQDMNSVFGDFTNDFSTPAGTIPYLRISNPRPFGSVLNDRGYRLHEHLNNATSGFNIDALNNGRGVNGQLFDIGAEEFEGRSYTSDVEFVMISSPSAYKSGSGTFDDAEHIMTYLPLQLKVILRNSGTLFQAATKVRLEVRDLDVDLGMVYYDTVETDIVVAQSKEIVFDLPNSLIRTFSDLEDLGFSPLVPTRFNPNMKPNVTPRYEFKIEIQADENNANNYGGSVMRFYLRKAEKTLKLISAENSNVDIYNLSGPVRNQDDLAGRLNYEALKGAFEKIGWYPGIKRDIDHPGELIDSFKVDVFDRLAWEPKAVDYKMYKYVFWSDRDDVDGASNRNYINRFQQWNIMEFLDEGATNNKRNMVIASQEAVRNLDFVTTNPLYDDKSTKFVNDYMRSIANGDGFAFGMGVDAHQKKIKGVSIGRDIVHTILRTGESFNYGGTIVNDANPFPGTVNMYTKGDGLANISLMYPEATTSPNKQSSGMSVTTLKKNFVYVGLDWRHFDDVERVLRTLLDFYNKNGGDDIPVELNNFNAVANNNRVEITWSTASEFNTAKFEIERAEINNDVKGSFFKIDEMSAAGTSNILKEYGPVIDKNVANGNSYVYRLKMIDLDGKFDYSNEKIVEFADGSLWLGDAQPNPAISSIVKFGISKNDDEVNVVLYDVNGRRIDVNPIFTEDGFMEIDLSMVQSGNYTLVLKSGNNILTRQFQVVK